ncbi:MAG: hypothetical protein H3Z52_04035 [archaeon]|nr:hypothetical protein [archaeon]
MLAIIKRNIHSSDFIGVDISVNMLKGVRLKAIDHCIVADALHLPIR